MALTKIDDRGLKTPIDLLDSEKIRLGTGNDLELYHDGSNSYIADTGTGRLKILTNYLDVKNAAENETIIAAQENGAVELFYDNSKKLETTSTGITITGGFIATNDADCFFTGATSGRDMLWDVSRDSLVFKDNAVIELGTGTDLQIYHNGSHSYIINGASSGTLNIRSDSHVYIQDFDGNTMADFNDGGAVELSYDGTKKFETASYGAGVTGYLQVGLGGGTNGLLANDNVKLRLGTDQDLEIYHDGTNSDIKNDTGDLRIRTDNFRVQNNAASEVMIAGTADGSVDLYYDNTKKFETSSTGGTLTGNLTVTGEVIASDDINISADSKNLNIGASADLKLYHNGTYSYITNSTGFLEFRSADYIFDSSDGTATYMKLMGGGAVELYHNGTKKFETRSDGVTLTGQIVQTSSSARAMACNRTGSAGQMILFDFQGNKCGEILVDTNSTSYVTSGSDRSLKKNFQSWNENILNSFKNINPQEFHFNNQQDTDKKHKGYIAQDMVDSFPEAYPKDDEGKYMFNPTGMVVYLMKAIQELETEIAALKAE